MKLFEFPQMWTLLWCRWKWKAGTMRWENAERSLESLRNCFWQRRREIKFSSYEVWWRCFRWFRFEGTLQLSCCWGCWSMHWCEKLCKLRDEKFYCLPLSVITLSAIIKMFRATCFCPLTARHSRNVLKAIYRVGIFSFIDFKLVTSPAGNSEADKLFYLLSDERTSGCL